MEEVQAKQKLTPYSLYMLMSPTMEEGELERAREEIAHVLEENKAHVNGLDKFAKSELAYPIAKNRVAYTANIQFLADPSAIHTIRDTLNLLDNKPLRYIISKEEEKKRIYKPKREARYSAFKERINEEAGKKTGTSSEAVKVEGSTEAKKDEGAIKTKTEAPAEDITSKQQKVTLEDIDKKLDEIMGDL